MKVLIKKISNGRLVEQDQLFQEKGLVQLTRF
jgi:hypothetical protein